MTSSTYMLLTRWIYK